ncbi:MAG: hypothetical protein IIZ12_01495 [Eggerthellaceae bacterium]|nr:hypothetical protein [Eggerthellaceae bacterium]
MTSLTEAQRNAMLHERVAVLERDKRDMNDAYSAKCCQVRELKAFIADLWSAYDFQTSYMHSAQKLNLRRKLDELGVSIDRWGMEDE